MGKATAGRYSSVALTLSVFLLGWEEIQAKVSWRTGTCKIKDQSVHCYDTAPRAYSQGNAAWMQVHLGPEACGLQLLEHVLR